jgi:hypothetical protein
MKQGFAAARGTSPAAKQPWRALMHALIAEAAAASDQLSMAQMCRVLS